MTDRPPSLAKAKHPPGAWSQNRKGQDRGPLRHLGSLRGAGTLIWSGGSAAVDYELDMFSRGANQSASGNLEGDLSVLLEQAPEDSPLPHEVYLRLDDGREGRIDLVALEAESAEFDGVGAAVSAWKIAGG